MEASLRPVAVGRPRPPSHRRARPALAATRTTADGPWSASSSSPEQAYERVLRYPDGKERRIRYPTGTSPENSVSAALSPTAPPPDTQAPSSDEWLRELAAAGRAAAGVVEKSALAAPSPPPPTALPSSPAALLALIRSPAWQAAAAEEEAALAASHVVLGEGCPWIGDRPLYAVALPPPPEPSTSDSASEGAPGEAGEAPGGAYTLRVRVERGEAAGELDALLAADRARRGKKQAAARPSSSSPPPLISVSALVDGIIVFACEAHAEAFAAALPSGTEPAGTAQVGAHELFRAASAAAAVVVFVRPPPPPGVTDVASYIGPDTFEEGWCPPDPADLAAALRAHKKKNEE